MRVFHEDDMMAKNHGRSRDAGHRPAAPIWTAASNGGELGAILGPTGTIVMLAWLEGSHGSKGRGRLLLQSTSALRPAQQAIEGPAGRPSMSRGTI
jgi:hypothetical protein